MNNSWFPCSQTQRYSKLTLNNSWFNHELRHLDQKKVFHVIIDNFIILGLKVLIAGKKQNQSKQQMFRFSCMQQYKIMNILWPPFCWMQAFKLLGQIMNIILHEKQLIGMICLVCFNTCKKKTQVAQLPVTHLVKFSPVRSSPRDPKCLYLYVLNVAFCIGAYTLNLIQLPVNKSRVLHRPIQQGDPPCQPWVWGPAITFTTLL